MRSTPLVLAFAACLATGALAPAHAQVGPNAGANPQRNTAPAGPTDPDRHIEAVGQGAQDPARSEVLEGRSRDMPRCLDTLIARRETPDEARTVCNKILHDLGE